MSKYAIFGIFMQCVLYSMVLATSSNAQKVSIEDIRVTIELENEKIIVAFHKLESLTDFEFAYHKSIIDRNMKLEISADNSSLAEILRDISRKTRLGFKRVDDIIYVNSIENFESPVSEHLVGLEQIIDGKVVDESGNALIGVNIIAKGTTIGTTTDVDGNYRLNVPDDVTILIFTYVGYLTEEVAINGRSTIDIALVPDFQTLSEIVVLGYGTQEKKDVTGAVSTIQGKVLTKAPGPNLEAVLAGKLTGVVTSQTTGQPGFDGTTFRIRGLTSYRGEQNGIDPNRVLVIVDGIERPFSRINPNNIESISILKDASATAVYGRRGANGVVLITTKRGETGKASFNYNGRFGWQSQTKEVEMMNAAEYSRYLNEGKENLGEMPVFTDQQVADYESGALPGYDWIAATLDDVASQQQHNISASGGTENVRYFVSYGYLDQNGFFSNSQYTQNSLRANIDTKFTDRLSMGLDLTGRLEDRKSIAGGGGIGALGDIFQLAAFAHPTENPFPDVPGVPDAIGFNGFSGSPLGRAERSGTNDRNDNIFQSNFSLSYEVPGIKGLQAKGLYAYDYTTRKENDFEIPYTWYQFNEGTNEYEAIQSGPNTNIESFERREEFIRKTLQLSLNYSKTFGAHSISALALFEQIENENTLLEADRRGFISTGIPSLFAGDPENDSNNSSIGESVSRGWIGRVSYSYQDKYLFQINGRVDRSFAFAEDFRTGFFPSFSVGWRLSEEPFLSSSDLFSNLKLRASWGQVGNDNVAQFQYLATYRFAGGTVVDGVFIQGIRSNGIPNETITWETVTSTNIGLDASFLEGKLEWEFDYFWRTTEDILDRPDGVVPASFGASILDRPIGEFDSWGLETLVRHTNRIGDLSYRIGGTFSWYDNKVVKFNEPEDINPALAQVGRRVGERIGYIADGLFQSQEEIDNHATQFGDVAPGDIKYRDINGRDEDGNLTGVPDGKIDGDDRVVIGRPGLPDITFGLNIDLEYKGFDLQANFQGATNFTRDIRPRPFERDNNALRVLVDSWRPGNEDAAYPRLTAGDFTANNGQTSSFWIVDVNYLRLRNVEIGYNFTGIQENLENMGIANLRLFVSANNLLTFSNLDWRDPEGPSGTGDAGRFPFYPQTKTISVGLNVGF